MGLERYLKSLIDNDLVDKLIDYHELNGGLSRFVKIKYFYEKLLNHVLGDETIIKLFFVILFLS